MADDKFKSGKEYAQSMKDARDFANDLGAILQNQVAGAAQSTQQAAADIANKLKNQTDKWQPIWRD